MGDNCAKHLGECAASLPYQNPKGREDQAVELTIISHITTDGDSTAFYGAEKAMAKQGHVVGYSTPVVLFTKNLTIDLILRENVRYCSFSQNFLREYLRVKSVVTLRQFQPSRKC